MNSSQDHFCGNPEIQRAVVVIPARIASTRLPRKILADICGKPMLWHVYMRSTRAHSIDQVWVATDSQEVAEVVQGWNGNVLLTDPVCPSGTARIASIVHQLEADIIVNVQGDEPLIAPQVIDQMVRALTQVKADIATPVYHINDLDDLANPNVVKVVRRHDGSALYFSRSPIPFVRDVKFTEWGNNANFWGHIGLYAYYREVLLGFNQVPVGRLERTEKLEQLRFLEAGYCIQTIESEYRSIAVDVAADLERVRTIVEEGIL